MNPGFYIKGFRWVGVLVILLFCTPIYSDYSSLTKRERAIVKEALQKAIYYQYYLELVEGRDRIEIRRMTKIGKNTYIVELDIIIKDLMFSREVEIEVEFYHEPSFWLSFQDWAYKISVGLITGILIGLAI